MVSFSVGAAFALEEAARDPARRVGVLAVVDGERQEVARHGARLHAGGGEDDGVAEADDARAVGLLGDVAGLESRLSEPTWTVLCVFIDFP